MLIIPLLFVCSAAVIQAQNQEDLKLHTHKDDSQWNPDGLIEDVSAQDIASDPVKVPHTEIQDFYQPNSPHGNPVSSDAHPFIYPLNPLEQRTEEFPSAVITQPHQSPTGNFQRLSNPEFLAQSFPVFYSPGLSVNVRRKYTNSGNEQRSSPDSKNANISTPMTTSYEEVFRRVVPPVSFPGMSFHSDPILPYNSLEYPTQFYPPAFGPLQPMRLPNGDTPSLKGNRNDDELAVDRTLGVENTPVSTEQASTFHSSLVRRNILSDGMSQNQPNAPDPLQELMQRYPAFNPATFISAPVLNRGQLSNERPLPLAGFPNLYGNANHFVPQNALPPPAQPYPFTLPTPAMPAAIPRFFPQNPTVAPNVQNTDVPASVVVKDRIPLAAIANSVLRESPETAEQDGVVSEGEQPDASVAAYEYGFDMNDGKGTDQHRMEVSNGDGVVRGSYGYRDLFGVYRLVHYVADKNGFRAYVKSNEPGVASTGSANVIVQAESPPPHVVEEATKAREPQAYVVPNSEADIERTE